MSRTTLIIGVAVLLAGCGGAKVEAKEGKAGTEEPGDMGYVNEGSRCEVGDRREVLVDLDQDGSPDVRKLYHAAADGEVLVCREADLNFDGTKDIFVYFDHGGNITRDEVDLDYDGMIDIISTYSSGKLAKQELDTNTDGRIDRVRYLQDDVPFRVEGDTDGDGKVDYWEYYEGGTLIRLGMDTDGDGRADKWSRDNEAEEAAMGGGEEPESEEGEGEGEGAEEEPAEDAENS